MKCPNCGTVMNTGGRKKPEIPFILLMNALNAHRRVKDAADSLGCSIGFIYNACREHKITVADVRAGKQP